MQRRTRLHRHPARLALLGLALGLAVPAQAQELTVGVQAPFGIDPHFLFVGPNMAASRHIYDSLINRDPESRMVPGIVESWRAVDETTWELKLRQGVTFHDGSPFTAEDVAFTLARVPKVPNNPGPYTSNLRTIRDVQVVDPFTVRLITDRPNPTLMGQLTNIFVVSKHAAENAGTADFTSGKAAIGTGPFRLENYRGAEGMSVIRNDAFWGDKAAYAKVNLRVIGNDAARIAALLAGDVDLIEDVAPADAARLEREGQVRVFKRNSDRIMFLIPQVGADTLPLLTDTQGQPLKENPLRDIRVRRALSLAVDRYAIAERAMDGQAVPTGQMVPRQFAGYDPDFPAPRADLEEARRLLAEAGYPDGFGLTVGCSNNRFVNDARVCQVVGQMLARLGLQAKVETQPSSVFFPRTVYGKNDLPLMLYGLSLSSSRDPSYILSTSVHTRNIPQAFGQGNRGAFSDPEMDRLIDAVIIRMDEGREAALRGAMHAAIERFPIIPLYNQVTIAAGRPTVEYTPRMDEQMVAYYARPAQAAR